MNNDRELLELAAKAVGYKREQLESGVWWTQTTTNQSNWNPITDDGDALRLAVTLNMCVTSFRDELMVGVRILGEGRNFSEPPGADPYAAMRRAIVRAAALEEVADMVGACDPRATPKGIAAAIRVRNKDKK